MKSVFDFFHMGGYAFYVWGSFGVTLICLVFEVWFLKQRRKELLKRLIMLHGRKS
ncbi:heme exporter protein CcmD [Sulfurirhabdus autotrophica]|uniref:Heme exporter protein D n=1 Tax=Sulfurirhabdus autotrophica TaxID=1706046 RepID=A0A4R3YBZ0_9PROT|nr:heme exporter protein CcmD [Sulfurirhabdus autotrophica]TCV89506.1 heme exporter protein D [Sulfurirhabdus autotrophica]